MKIRNVFLFVTLFAPLFCRAEVPGLPEEVSLALAAAGIQESSLSATVAPLDGKEGFPALALVCGIVQSSQEKRWVALEKAEEERA